MAPKSVLEAVLGASWGFLGALGPILATRAENPSTLPLVTPPLESQAGTKISLKIDPEAYQKVIIFLIACGVGFCCHLVPTWLQLGRQNPPQIQPSWLQDPSKVGSRCRPICCLIFDRPGIVFFSILLRSWTAESPKNFSKCRTICKFSVFCYFGQLANKRPYDRFFGQLGSQFGTQNSPKIYPRGSQDG